MRSKKPKKQSPSVKTSSAKNRKYGEIHLFIELRDTGYPGATYNLMYNSQYDALAGIYYQPTAGQQFQVVFL